MVSRDAFALHLMGEICSTFPHVDDAQWIKFVELFPVCILEYLARWHLIVAFAAQSAAVYANSQGSQGLSLQRRPNSDVTFDTAPDANSVDSKVT